MGSWSYSEAFGGGGWNGYENYITIKNQRINDQLKTQTKDTSLKTDEKSMIFQKCVFWLDGRTRIAEDRLKELMVLYGGEYEASTLSRVTHVVADNLALGNQRWREIRDKGTKQFFVVTSEWIVACVEKGCKIPESYFTPSCLKDTVSGFGSIFRFMMYASKDVNSIETVSENEPHSVTNEASTNLLMCNDDFKNNDGTEKEVTNSFPILCTDECKDFVTKFFNASRLHFIGRWRERLALKFCFFPFVLLLPQWTNEKNHLSSKDSVLKRFVVSKTIQTTSNVSKVASIILHIDFDAFFVSVALKKYPHLLNKPVAVCHGTGSNSGSEIASCNYVARQFGVEKGMWLRNGKQLCPDLHVLPYDFQSIEQASLCMMNVLTDVTSRVLPVSCDEAYLQLVGDYEMTYCQEIAAWIQQEVLQQTGCSVSIGIAPNLLLAKIATGYAKPKCSQQVARQSIFQATPPYKTFMSSVPLSSLPGIGSRSMEKLQTAQLETCKDITERCTLQELQRLLGEKQGATCYSFCFGCDPRPFPALAISTPDKNRSLTVSINWGIRLTTEKGVQNFLFQMSEECEKRLAAEELGTCDITLKILKRSPDAPFEPAKYGGCGMCDELSQACHNTQMLLVNANDIYECVYQLWSQPAISQNIEIPDLRGVTICMMKLQKKNQKKKEFLQQSIQEFQQNMQNNEKINKESMSVQNNTIPLERQVHGYKTTEVKKFFQPDITPILSSINFDDCKKELQPHIITKSTSLQEPLESDRQDHDENCFFKGAPRQQKLDSFQLQSSISISKSPSVWKNALQPAQIDEGYENSSNQLKEDIFYRNQVFKKPQDYHVTPRKRLGGSNKDGQKNIYKNKEPSQRSCMFDKKKKNLQPTLLQLMKKVSSLSSSLNNPRKRQEFSSFASSINKKQCNAIDIIDIDETSSDPSPHSSLPLCCQNDTIHSTKHLTSPQHVLPLNSNESDSLTMDQYCGKTPTRFCTPFTKSSTIQEKTNEGNVNCQSHTQKQSQKKSPSTNINIFSLDLHSPSVPPPLDVQSPCVPPFSNQFASDLLVSEGINTNLQAPKHPTTTVHPQSETSNEKKEDYLNESAVNHINTTENEKFFNTAKLPYVEQNLFDTIIQMKNSVKETEQHFVDVHVPLNEDCISISDSSYSEIELTYCPNVVMVCILPTPTSPGQLDNQNITQEIIRDSVDSSSLKFADMLPFEAEENSFFNKNGGVLSHHAYDDENITREKSPNCDNRSSLESADMLPFEAKENSFYNKNGEALSHHAYDDENITREKSPNCDNRSSLESADMLPFEAKENSFYNKNGEALSHHAYDDENITREKSPNCDNRSSLESADMLPFDPEEDFFVNESIEALSHHACDDENIIRKKTPNCNDVSSLESANMLPFAPEENSFLNKKVKEVPHHSYDDENITREKSRNCDNRSSLESADMLPFDPEEDFFVNESLETLSHHACDDENIIREKTPNCNDVSSLESANILPFQPENNSFVNENVKALLHHSCDDEKMTRAKTPNSVCKSAVCLVETPRYQVVESSSVDFAEETLPSMVCHGNQATYDKTNMLKETIFNEVHSNNVSEISMTTKNLDRKDDTDNKTVADSTVMERAVVGIVDIFGLCSAIEHRARMFQSDILDHMNEPRYTHCVCGGANETFSKIVSLKDSFTSPFSLYTSWLSKACWMCVACTFVQHYTQSSPLINNLLITQFGTTLIMVCFLLSLIQVSPESPRIQSFPITFILEEIWGIATCFSLHRDIDIRNTYLLGLLSLTKNWNVFNDSVTSMISPSIHSSKHPLSQTVLKLWNSLQQVTEINSKTINEHVLISSFHQLRDCLERMIQQDKCHFLSHL